MSHARALLGLGPIVATLLGSPAAFAWTPDTHAAAVRAAIRLSDAAESRLPAEHRDALISAAREGDPLDPQCEEHPGTPPGDAAAQAERALAQILSGKGLERPYTRAQAIGRYLHFVADCAIPQGLDRDELFQNRSFVVFREPRPLGTPLAERLRERLRETAWADAGDSARTAAFRATVNLLVDALLLLPPRTGRESVPDTGPTLFLVDTVDNGRAGEVKVSNVKKRLEIERRPTETILWQITTWTETRRRDEANLSILGLNTVATRPGVQVVEWASHGGTVRALLVNNDRTCARDIRLMAGSWSATLPVSLAPLATRVVEFNGPANVAPEQVRGSVSSYECAAPFPASSGTPTDRRVILGTAPGPTFDGPEVSPPKASGPLGTKGGRLKDPPVPER